MSTDPTAEHIDRKPQPGDGPDYHYDLAAWEERQRRHAALAASLPAEVMLAALVDRGTLKRSTQRGTLISGRLGTLLDVGGPDRVLCERFASDWREVAP